MTKLNRARDRIEGFYDSSNIWVDNLSSINQVFIDYFEKCFSDASIVNHDSILECLRSQNIPRCSQNDFFFLNQPFIGNEVKEIVFQLGALFLVVGAWE